MKANPSERWKNEILEVIENHDFEYVEVYDAGRRFRQDDHQCDFCGSHLRYTAVVQAETDQSLEYGVGLDCLEHLMGTRWSRLREVERAIKDLKEEAKRNRRIEAYQEEYGDVIKWIEEYLDLKYNSFLKDMHRILTEGTRDFTRPMEETVKKIYDETDLEDLKIQQRQKKREAKSTLRRVENVLDLVAEVDDVEIDDDYNRQDGVKNDTFRFVRSVYGYVQNRGKISSNQMESLNEIFKEYKEKKEQTANA